MGDIVHLHDVLTLHVDRAGHAEIALQRAGAVIELDALGRGHYCVHENKKVVGAVVLFLMGHQKVAKGLFKLNHDILL
jgi:hypothetical protein